MFKPRRHRNIQLHPDRSCWISTDIIMSGTSRAVYYLGRCGGTLGRRGRHYCSTSVTAEGLLIQYDNRQWAVRDKTRFWVLDSAEWRGGQHKRLPDETKTTLWKEELHSDTPGLAHTSLNLRHYPKAVASLASPSTVVVRCGGPVCRCNMSYNCDEYQPYDIYALEYLMRYYMKFEFKIETSYRDSRYSND